MSSGIWRCDNIYLWITIGFKICLALFFFVFMKSSIEEMINKYKYNKITSILILNGFCFHYFQFYWCALEFHNS